jgi:hypothetical protein
MSSDPGCLIQTKNENLCKEPCKKDTKGLVIRSHKSRKTENAMAKIKKDKRTNNY